MAGVQLPAKGIDPVAPSPSLLTAARRSDFGVGAEWARTGVAWNPATCTPSHARQDAAAGTQNTDEKLSANPFGRVAVDPFTVYTWVECDWHALTGEGSLDGAAQALSEAHTAQMLARALWFGEGLAAVATDSDTGALVNPTLRSAAVDLSADAATTPEEGVEVLLNAHTECVGGSGGATLHIPDIIIPDLFGSSGGGKTLELQGNKLVVPSLGASVSPGPGYPVGKSTQGASGNGPEIGTTGNYLGNNNDELWFYVTGPVEYASTPPKLTDTDPAYRRMNRHVSLAENRALVRFDPCCVFAQKVTNPIGAVS